MRNTRRREPGSPWRETLARGTGYLVLSVPQVTGARVYARRRGDGFPFYWCDGIWTREEREKVEDDDAQWGVVVLRINCGT
jgi:hypothetical protein